ncbi:hypothetical protein V1282_003910 [Nitrobacteraceae bacterium AZCC 2146]
MVTMISLPNGSPIWVIKAARFSATVRWETTGSDQLKMLRGALIIVVSLAAVIMTVGYVLLAMKIFG